MHPSQKSESEGSYSECDFSHQNVERVLIKALWQIFKTIHPPVCCTEHNMQGVCQIQFHPGLRHEREMLI